MKVRLFNPRQELKDLFGAECISYVYDTGINIVRHFGNVFVVRLTPQVHYLILSRGSEINTETAFICSNKYDYEDHPNLEEKFTRENSFKDMHTDKYLGGMPSNIHGRPVIISFPIGNKLPFVLDVESEEYLPIIPPEYKGREGLDEYFNKMEELYGDCSDLFDRVKPEFKMLDVYPCGEYAEIYDTKYVIAYGWQLKRYYADEIKMKAGGHTVKYLILNINKKVPNECIYSNKWGYDSYTKIKDWMKEPGAHKKMLASAEYSGLPCNLNGHKVIVCYPFLVYNPVIWDAETDEVFVLPSKAYPGDPYWEHLVEKYGEIY